MCVCLAWWSKLYQNAKYKMQKQIVPKNEERKKYGACSPYSSSPIHLRLAQLIMNSTKEREAIFSVSIAELEMLNLCCVFWGWKCIARYLLWWYPFKAASNLEKFVQRIPTNLRKCKLLEKNKTLMYITKCFAARSLTLKIVSLVDVGTIQLFTDRQDRL